MFILSFLVLVLDQLTKFFALRNIPYAASIPVIKNIFHLSLVKNTGSAFGLFKNMAAVFVLVAVLSAIVIGRYLLSKKDKLDIITRISLHLILAGAVGNLIDRLRFGYVVDFLDFRIWPVFNIADSAITIGALLFGWQIITKSNTKNQKP
ncbi:MAG: signal peptidase II [Candidatus Omnitrophica bacterium CG11_big_fil_rev_8_21_14_0_20_42_13]|uniref:Lipoprotein signal peptidase n=1 Tax=Candidatus Ghiorseimicrobium undicola TaxID=1974746 RepID=A0A2H0LV41_9BACT|nr:MAG: signal peptidase II [Candidatus Omnitrophica bacterium CG11_big_fil_rev_8_21_14_0_20_42_13]